MDLYGRIDQSNVSPLGEFESDNVVLDCFSATRRILAGTKPHPEDSEESLDEHYAVLAFSVHRDAWRHALGQAAEPADDRWFKLTLKAGSGNGHPVVLAGSGDASEPELKLIAASVASEDMQQKLNIIVGSTFNGPGASVARIVQVIAQAIEGATFLDTSVVDVGQGSLAALHPPGGQPALFFDLGWPTMFHAASAPKLKPQLSNDGAPVVLSHWDWDHWALAIDKAGWSKKRGCWSITWNNLALDRPWLVPGSGSKWGDVKLGPIHWRLALALSRRKQLFRWPASSPTLAWNLLTIYRATGGAKKDRNQHGLAMVIDNAAKSARRSKPRRAVLLPGDADYINLPCIHAGHDYLFCGLAATHHGARFTAAGMPKASAPAWLAYSVGQPNHYGHPKERSQHRYIRAGWNYQALTTHRVVQAGAAESIAANGSVLLTTAKMRVLPATAAGIAWLGKQ